MASSLSGGLVASLATLILSFALAYLVAAALYNCFFHPLAKYPGPFWASISTLWYQRTVRNGIRENCQLPLHEKYGPFVRIGPNTLAISDPAAIETIYGPNRKTGQPFEKAEFYDGFWAHIGPRQDSFSETNEMKHSQRRRIQAPLYTQSAVLGYEPCVDRIIGLFHRRLDGFSRTSEAFDISIWIRKYTFDVLGEIFFGREEGFGMLRDDVDYNDWCECMNTMPDIGASITYIPYGLRTAYMISQVILGGKAARQGVAGLTKVVADAKKTAQDRLRAQETDSGATTRKDMLSKLIDLVKTRGGELNWTMLDVTTEIWAVIWAGADTTAIALTAVFYFTHKHPHVLSKLRSEIDEAFDSGKLTSPVRFKDTIRLPFLNAVVKESMRLHPSLGTGLPRVVPPSGAEIAGRWIPGNTTVIMNQNAVHLDPNVFGPDPKAFVPERWLDENRATIMSRHDMSFGYGTRICVGRHITMIEMYKLLPVLLRFYTFEFADPNAEWSVWHGWFQHQKNVNVTVRERRDGVEG
ncbi:cytochrome P450 [Hortaea werneckii]|nr:cytochrome P450 [Hortaea werneckii]